MVPLFLGSPKTRVRQGGFRDIRDHSREGCSPFLLRGTAQDPRQPALSQALTILKLPPFRGTNHLVSPLGNQPTDQGSPLWVTLPKGASTWRLQQRMVLPRRAPEMWRHRWNPRFCSIPPRPSQRPHSSPSPPPISFSPEKQMPGCWVAAVDSGLPIGNWVGGEFPFLSSPLFL